MAGPLKLEVVMSMVDKALAPLRGIDRQAKATAKGLKDTRDSLKGLERAQDDLGAFRKLGASMRAGGAELDAARTKVRALAQQLKATDAPTRAMQREFSKAKSEAAALGQQQEKMGVQAQVLRDRLSAAGISTRNLGEHERQLRGRIESATQSIARKTAALQAQGAQQRKLADIQERQSKAAMRSAATLGAGYGGLTAGRAAGGAIGQFMGGGVEFDATMSKVQALARLQKNSGDLAALRQQSKDLGDSTMFSATDAAQGQAFLAMAGFNPKAIMGAMPGMLDMAKAGDMEIGQTADISSNILSAFGIDPSKMGNVADVLTKTFTTSNVNLAMLGDTMRYVGPVARAAGVDLETTAAMAGLLGNVGIQGDKAGTAMRAMLLRLSAPTSGAAKQLEKLGVKTKDAVGNIKPIVPLLAEIAAKTEKMGSGDRMAALKDIFGEEPAAAMTEIISKAGSTGILDYLAIVRDNAGAAQATAKTMADNMRGSLDELSSAWDTLGINVGESNDSWMRSTVDRLTEITRSVGNWANQNPALVKALTIMAVVLAALMTAFGVLAITLGLVVGKVMLVRFALATLGVQGGLLSVVLRGVAAAVRFVGGAIVGVVRLLMANPIIAIVAAIATAAYLIYTHWGAISGFFSRLWASVQAGAVSAWQGITGRIYQAFAGVVNYFGTELPSRFAVFGQNIVQGLANGILNSLGAVRSAVGAAADGALGWFKDKLGIRSPSRVFMAAGVNVGEGAALGIDSTQGMLRRAAGAMAAATAVALPAFAAMPELAQPQALAAIDSRSPLGATSAARQAPQAPASAAASMTFNIHAAPGMDVQALAATIRAQVRAELDRRDTDQRARSAGSFYDLNN